jgi:hypothetical protein
MLPGLRPETSQSRGEPRTIRLVVSARFALLLRYCTDEVPEKGNFAHFKCIFFSEVDSILVKILFFSSKYLVLSYFYTTPIIPFSEGGLIVCVGN